MAGTIYLWVGSLTSRERSGRPAWGPFHGQRYTPGWNVTSKTVTLTCWLTCTTVLGSLTSRLAS